MKVITTNRTHKRIGHIARHGTKRQRAKYRNAYVTICRNGIVVGEHYGFQIADPKGERRFERAERQRGVATPTFSDNGTINEPAWHGIKGRRGFFWTLWQPGAAMATSMTDPAAQDETSMVWVGRADWY